MKSKKPTYKELEQEVKMLREAKEIYTHVKVEGKLEESEEKYRSIIEASPLGILLYELKKKNKLVFKGYNKSAENILDVKCDAFIGKTIEEAFPPLAKTEIPKAYIKTATTGEPFFTNQVDYDHGDIKGAYEVHAYQISPNNIAVNFSDITEKLIKDEQLKDSQQKFKSLFDNIEEGVALHQMIFDKNKNPVDFIWVDVNPTYEKITQLKKKDLIGNKGKDVIPGIEKKWYDLYTEVVLTGIPKTVIDHSKYLDKYWEVKAFRPKEGHFAIAMTDVTDKVKAEKEIARNQFIQQKLISNIGDVIVILDKNGINRYKSPSVKKHFGWEADELVGKSAWDKVHPDDIENGMKIVANLAQKPNHSLTTELRYLNKNGEYRWIQITITNLLNDPDINGFLGNYHDITERKLAEQELIKAKERAEESEEKHHSILQTTQDGFWIADLEGNLLEVNESYCKMSGYNTNELLGMKIADVEAIQKPDDIIQIIDKIKSQKKFSFETKHKKKDGNVYDVEVSVQYQDFEVGQFVCFIRDITERKNSQRELTLKEKRFRNIVENSTNVFYSHTANQEITYISPKIHDILGYRPEELMKEWTSFITDNPINKEGFEKTKQAIKTGKRQPTYLLELRHKNGNNILVEVREEPIVENGKVESIVGSLADVTELIKAEQALNKNKLQFEILMKNSPICNKKLDLDFNLQYMNQGGIDQLKIEDVNEFYDKPYPFYFFPEAFKQAMRNALEKVKKTAKETRIEGILSDTKGNKKWYNHILVPIKNDAGQLDHFWVLSTDISERKQAEQELIKAKEKAEKSEEQFNLAMKASNDGLFDWNLETNEIYYSPGWKKMLGYEDQELPNDFSVWEKTTEPEDVKKSWELQQKLIAKEVDRFVMEFKMKHKKGYWVDILSRAEAVFNDDGKAIRIVGTHTDITKQKKAAKELKAAKEKAEESEARFKALHNASFGGITIHDKGLILDCNKGLSEMTGYDINELIGMDGLLLIAEESRPMVLEKIESAYEKPYEAIGVRKNGEKYPIRLEAREVPYKGKNVRTVEFRDITAQKKRVAELNKAKEKAEESEEVFRKLFEDSSDAILLIDETGVFVECNQAALNLLKMTRKQFLFQSPVNISPDYQPNGRKSEEAAIEMIELAHKNGMHRFDWTCINNEDEEFIVEVSLMPINLKGQTFLHTTWRDITQRKQDELELIETKERAEESDRLKTAFLANMSHEIRTPMNGILGFTDLLSEADLSGDEKQKYINIIQNNGDRLLSTVNDIIDISKIEAGQMEITTAEVNIRDLMEQIHTFFNLEATQKGLEFMLDISSPKQNIVLNSDGEKINAIFINLIKNAIKYTPSGKVEFGYQKIKNEIQFFVKDSGIGISQEGLEVIFDRFRRVSNEEGFFSEGGSGLGLSITKAYVEMLGGRIWVESEKGVGTQFYFTIPYAPSKVKISSAKNVGTEAESKSRIKELKILIAEDDESSVEYLKVVLKDIAGEFIHALNGKDALDLTKKHPDIDLILMDINMPGMNGYDATKEIRKFNKEVLIIAQTAYALTGDQEKAIEAGCDDYISKPIKRKELLEKMENCLVKK